MVDRITEVYWRRIRVTGIGNTQVKAGREELRAGVAVALQHVQQATPEAVTELETSLDRYDRLRVAAGVDRILLEEPSKLLPGPLGHAQGILEAGLGLIPAMFGFVTGALPYFAARSYLHQTVPPSGDGVSRARLALVATVAFAPFYAALIALVAWQFSNAATILFGVLLVPTGLFALLYAARMRSIAAHIGQRTASWFKLGDVAQVRMVRDELIGDLDGMRNRYRSEVHGWEPLPANATRRTMRAGVARLAFVTTSATIVLLLIAALPDAPIPDLPLGPSPWQTARLTDPVGAERDLRRDAEGVLLAARQLDRLEREMGTLYEEFQRGERHLLSQEDHDAMRVVMVAFHDLRVALLKTVWLYRGTNSDEAEEGADPVEAAAFLTAYTAASLLVEKSWVVYETFREDPTTRAQLDLADAAWGLPAGTYSDVVVGLTNRSVMAEVRAAARRFDHDRAQGSFPPGAPWSALANRAALSRPEIDQAIANLGARRLDRTFRDMAKQLQSPVTELTPVISMAVSRFRFKERPPHRGLISPEQVEELRRVLRPGDILIERRNWYISNSLLPGFWPHAALYLGSPQQLAELGVTDDPRAAPHMEALGGRNELGDPFAVIEAIGEGVIFTSLEQSAGEADALAVLRPNLDRAELRDAIARALSHRGKGYDFDFDFTTPDRLVCTELIFRTYDGILEFPEMPLIMGQPRLAAVDYVRMWADERDSGAPQLDLVTFLDFDEENQRAVESSADVLAETVHRSRFTFVR
ncbi:MAG: YiiX/YebB-like N1pC/P60 family cysteine hydrolase [Longimicrobiales bacterium]